MELAEEVETASAPSLPSSAGSSPSIWDTEACSMASSTPRKCSMLEFFSSEELEALNIEAGEIEDLPPSSPTYVELVEAVTCAW